jgi:hypothetical protein
LILDIAIKKIKALGTFINPINHHTNSHCGTPVGLIHLGLSQVEAWFSCFFRFAQQRGGAFCQEFTLLANRFLSSNAFLVAKILGGVGNRGRWVGDPQASFQGLP